MGVFWLVLLHFWALLSSLDLFWIFPSKPARGDLPPLNNWLVLTPTLNKSPTLMLMTAENCWCANSRPLPLRRGLLRRISSPDSSVRAALSTPLPPKLNMTWPLTWDKPPDPKLPAPADTAGVPWTARPFHKLWLKWPVCPLSKLKTGLYLSSIVNFLVTLFIHFPPPSPNNSNTI